VKRLTLGGAQTTRFDFKSAGAMSVLMFSRATRDEVNQVGANEPNGFPRRAVRLQKGSRLEKRVSGKRVSGKRVSGRRVSGKGLRKLSRSGRAIVYHATMPRPRRRCPDSVPAPCAQPPEWTPRIFRTDADHATFLAVLAEAVRRFPY
jgi:hypothetical protein